MATSRQRSRLPSRRQAPAIDCLETVKTTATPTLVSIARLALLELATRNGVTRESYRDFLRAIFDERLCPFEIINVEEDGEQRAQRRETTAGYVWTRLSASSGYGSVEN